MMPEMFPSFSPDLHRKVVQFGTDRQDIVVKKEAKKFEEEVAKQLQLAKELLNKGERDNASRR